MIERHRVEYWSTIIQIFIDLCNLVEQLTIYFIVKEESSDDRYEQRLFFFVLLVIGLLSNLPSASPHIYFQTIGSISIEFGELLAYLFLLEKSPGIILVAFVSFSIEFILHCIHIILEYYSTKKEENVFVFGKTTCGRIKYVILRSISYTVFNATSILFLFLSQKSRFHRRIYEILILLTFYFPSIALGPALESITKYKYQYEHNQVPQVTILLIWSLFCATIYYIMYCVPLSITGIVFAIQELREINQYSGYDFFVYASSLCFFSVAILVFPPFMVWWWKFTVQRFKTMRIDAKKRLKQINEEDDTQQCL